MRVLVACEFSGIVRDAFSAKGHDAWSCDLLPSERNGNHIVGDAIEVAYGQPWDLLVFHAPCTYLCNSGVRWLYGGKGSTPDRKRFKLMEEAADFFKRLYNAPIARVCGENPIPHRFAVERIGATYTQIIHPWQHGHPESKATCLWLKGLPELVPSNIVSGRTPRVHFASPGPDRWKERSRTLPGIAQAMAQQFTQSTLTKGTTPLPALPHSLRGAQLKEN